MGNMKEAVQRLWARLWHKGVFVSSAECSGVMDDMVAGGLVRKSIESDDSAPGVTHSTAEMRIM
jgi:hypothetical protein